MNLQPMQGRDISLSDAGLRPGLLRGLNWILRHGSSRSKLHAGKLIDKARASSGLRDLGPDFDVTPLEVLTDSINREARLSALGYFIMKKRLTDALVLRLRAQKWFDLHPEILEIEIVPVILITGLQRTGTTFLQRLISSGPGVRGLMSWEALDPVPHGHRDERSRRIAKARLAERALAWMAPAFFSIHPVRHLQPEEDVLLLDASFMSTAPEAIMHVPTYADWLEKQTAVRAYSWEKKMLQLLQWQRAGERWVLKSPHHLEFLRNFIEIFPDTRIIWTHRDPVECVPSFLSMVYHGRRIFSDEVSIEEVKAHWLRKMARMVAAGIRDVSELPEDRIYHCRYADLVSDPLRVTGGLTGFLGIGGENAESWDVKAVLGELENGSAGAHMYDLSMFGSGTEEISTLFEHYYSKFNLNSSAGD